MATRPKTCSSARIWRCTRRNLAGATAVKCARPIPGRPCRGILKRPDAELNRSQNHILAKRWLKGVVRHRHDSRYYRTSNSISAVIQNQEGCMKGNLVIVCRDQDADAFDHLLAEYGAFQTRLSSTAWYLRLDVAPEVIQEEILARFGKYTTHYIFDAATVTYNTVDSEAASALNTLFD